MRHLPTCHVLDFFSVPVFPRVLIRYLQSVRILMPCPPHRQAARLEMIWQCSRFGEVEWAHPMDAADTTARLAASAIFARQFK